jgi:rare lipoprotein A
MRRGRGWWRAAWLAAALGVAGCSVFHHEPAPPPVVGGVQLGVASWYGPGFHGNRTANGEIYDQYELTVAHPSLPLGTRAVVTNLSNGRAVEVRINDRGPSVEGRIIDLSFAAAKELGAVPSGTVPVRIRVISQPSQ